jgi:hypothetical protein
MVALTVLETVVERRAGSSPVSGTYFLCLVIPRQKPSGIVSL